MYHGLDDNYRPEGHPESPPLPPAYPQRVKAFIYGCAAFCEEQEVERMSAMSGAAMSRRAGAG